MIFSQVFLAVVLQNWFGRAIQVPRPTGLPQLASWPPSPFLYAAKPRYGHSFVSKRCRGYRWTGVSHTIFHTVAPIVLEHDATFQIDILNWLTHATLMVPKRNAVDSLPRHLAGPV